MPRTTKPSAKAPRRSSNTKARAGAIRTFKSACAFLDQYTNFETMVRVGYTPANFNLSRMSRILTAIGNPHRNFKSVHIAGTKGKGSTCHMLASMLRNCGLKTGLYTSPHLVSLRERIDINGQLVSEAEFTRLMATLDPVVRKAKDTPTFFEILTAAAFLHFAEQEVDFAVIETGLGGRLDSTNVLKPEAVGFTHISYDHMAQLGNTLEAITEEKAGIMKPGVPAVTCEQSPAARRVLKEAAERVGCPLSVVGEDIEFSYRFECSRLTGPVNRICMSTKTSRFDHVSVPLMGEHQAMNCSVALGVIDALRAQGFDLPEQTAVAGLDNVRMRGRIEIIRENPRTVIDGAHNAASISALMRGIGQNINYDSMVVIFGCSQGKDITGMLKEIQTGADKIIFTSTGTPRSMDPRELHARFVEISPKMAMVEPELGRAYQTALHCVGRDDLICITGSIHLIGKAIAELSGAAAEPTMMIAGR